MLFDLMSNVFAANKLSEVQEMLSSVLQKIVGDIDRGS